MARTRVAQAYLSGVAARSGGCSVEFGEGRKKLDIATCAKQSGDIRGLHVGFIPERSL